MGRCRFAVETCRLNKSQEAPFSAGNLSIVQEIDPEFASFARADCIGILPP
jgi:hypothetical protein